MLGDADKIFTYLGELSLDVYDEDCMNCHNYSDIPVGVMCYGLVEFTKCAGKAASDVLMLDWSFSDHARNTVDYDDDMEKDSALGDCISFFVFSPAVQSQLGANHCLCRLYVTFIRTALLPFTYTFKILRVELVELPQPSIGTLFPDRD